MKLQQLYEEHKDGPISNEVLFQAIAFLDLRLKRKRSAELLWRVFILVVCGLLSWGVYTDWRQDQRTERERVERTVAACQQFNISEQRQIAAEKAQIAGLIAASIRFDDTPERREAAEQFLMEQFVLIEETHPLRDCSIKGIEEFLSTTTTQGN